MTRTTDDPLLAALVQESLEAAAFYSGKIDGLWGPQSELAFTIYTAHERYKDAATVAIRPSAGQQADLAVFLKNWKNDITRAVYEKVAVATGLPAELVAALHYRECPDFPAMGTYLHNGDPLTAGDGHPIPTTHEPKGLLFDTWQAAAVDAIRRETMAWRMSGIEQDEHNLTALCVFAEFYNGEGYTARGIPDPYILAGTADYQAGKFTDDHGFDPHAIDAEVGVLPLLRALAV